MIITVTSHPCCDNFACHQNPRSLLANSWPSGNPSLHGNTGAQLKCLLTSSGHEISIRMQIMRTATSHKADRGYRTHRSQMCSTWRRYDGQSSFTSCMGMLYSQLAAAHSKGLQRPRPFTAPQNSGLPSVLRVW